MVPRPVLDEIDGRLLSGGVERDRERYRDCDLTGYDLTGSTFTECDFSTVTLYDAQLRGSRFVECHLSSSFAPSLLAARTSWREVLVENPRWGSAELFEADLSSVHVRGGKIDYLNLRTSKITDLLIEDCAVTDLDLGGCRGTRIALRNCRIETLDVTRASLMHVDLRSTALSTVNGLEGLGGSRSTTINSHSSRRSSRLTSVLWSTSGGAGGALNGSDRPRRTELAIRPHGLRVPEILRPAWRERPPVTHKVFRELDADDAHLARLTRVGSLCTHHPAVLEKRTVNAERTP